MRDYSREAAHERYEKAAALAANAGSHTQAGLNEAYKQLNQNASWTPEDGWAENYQEGAEAYIPSWLIQDEDAFPSYPTVQPEDAAQKPASMSIDWDGLAKKGEDVKRENKRMAAIAYPELRPQYEKELSEDLDSYNQQELQWAKDHAKSDLMATWPLGDEEGLQEELAKIDAWTSVPGIYADERRRWYDEEGNLSSNPNIFGITSQRKTPQVARDLYDYRFALHDQADDDEDYLTSRMSGGVVNPGDIDDGDPRGREAEKMTGEQYYKYRTEYGLPGRPVEDIVNDPYTLYSKQDEMDNYGFIPYLTSDEAMYGNKDEQAAAVRDFLVSLFNPYGTEGYMPDESGGYDVGYAAPNLLKIFDPYNYGFQGEAALDLVNNLYGDFSNVRRNSSDFVVTDGADKFSGKGFVDSYDKWSRAHEGESFGLVSDPAEAIEGAVPVGAYNEKTGEYAPEAFNGIMAEDGSVYVRFSDGSEWNFANEDEFKDKISYPPVDENNAVFWYNIPPVEMQDGKAIRWDKARDIADEILGNANNGLVDYGIFNWNKPAVQMPEFDKWPEELPGWIAEGNLAPWATDMLFGSLPYFLLPIGEFQGLAHAASRAHGIRPGRDFDTGEYSFISEDPTKKLANDQAFSAGVLPLTEHIWGPLGTNTIGQAWKFAKKQLGLKPPSDNPLVRILSGALGEAAEEIPGNIFEEGENTGFDEWYWDYADQMFDKAGRPIRVPTSRSGQVHNFAMDAPESMAGGGLLGGAFGSVGEIVNAVQRKRLKDRGEDVEEPSAKILPWIDDTNRQTGGLSEDFLKYLNE